METMHAAGRRRLPPVPRSTGDRPSAGQLTVERPETASPVVEPAEGPATDGARSASVVAAPAPPASRANPTRIDRTDADRFDTELIDTELIDTRQIAAELIEAELAAAPAPPAAAVVDDEGPSPTAADDTEHLDVVVPAVTEDGTAEGAGEEAPTLDSAALDPAVLETLLLTGPADGPDPAQQFVARLRSSATDFAGAAGAQSAVVREAVPPARHRRARCRLVLRFADGTEIDVTLLGPAGRPGRPSRHGFDRQILRWLGAGLVRDDSWLTTDPDAPDGIAVDLTAWVCAD